MAKPKGKMTEYQKKSLKKKKGESTLDYNRRVKGVNRGGRPGNYKGPKTPQVGKTVKGSVKKIVKRKVVKGKNPKNPSIMNTPTKDIPKRLVAKAKQKVKNVLKNTPKQNIKKALFGDANVAVKIAKKMVKGGKKIKKAITKVKK